MNRSEQSEADSRQIFLQTYPLSSTVFGFVILKWYQLHSMLSNKDVSYTQRIIVGLIQTIRTNKLNTFAKRLRPWQYVCAEQVN